MKNPEQLLKKAVSTPKPGINVIEPFFDPDSLPNFFERSSVKYKTMTLNDLRKCEVNTEPLDALLPYLPNGAFIAGGFLRSLIANDADFKTDIDIFFTGSRAFNEMLNAIIKPMSGRMAETFRGYYPDISLEDLRQNSKKYRLINFIPHSSYEYKPRIQLIKMVWYPSIDAVIDSFDLTICQFATDGESIVFNPLGFEDIKNKKLRIHKSQSSLITLDRLLKYENKGYKASASDFKSVADDAVKIVLSGKVGKNYFYLPNDFTNNSIDTLESIEELPRKKRSVYDSYRVSATTDSKNEKSVPVKWLKRAWKYLIEGERGKEVYDQIMKIKKDDKPILKDLLGALDDAVAEVEAQAPPVAIYGQGIRRDRGWFDPVDHPVMPAIQPTPLTWNDEIRLQPLQGQGTYHQWIGNVNTMGTNVITSNRIIDAGWASQNPAGEISLEELPNANNVYAPHDQNYINDDIIPDGDEEATLEDVNVVVSAEIEGELVE